MRKLTSIYEDKDAAAHLYELLTERPSIANISHKKMPSWEEHIAFLKSKPYAAWYFIWSSKGEIYKLVGAIYLTHFNEIGVAIFNRVKGCGHGPWAIQEIMRLHGPKRYLANISPQNTSSRSMFTDLGFKMIQVTYELETEA